MKVPAPITVDAADPCAAESIAALSAASGVFCLEVEGRVTHLGSAPNLQRRIARTVSRLARYLSQEQQEHEDRPALRIHSWITASKLEASLLLYQLAKEHFPHDYLRRVHLPMPWFVGLFTRDPFPRLVSANRIPQGCEPVVGPFARRDLALLYEQEVQSAFLLRRCVEILEPDSQHPGCIYGEMKQCLRPCQCATESPRYLAEAAAVSAVLRENGGRSLRDMLKVRDDAIQSLDFESAARIHKQVEKLQSAKAARDPVITNVDNFNGLALALADRDAYQFQLFPMLQGRWLNPVCVAVGIAPEKEWHDMVKSDLATALENPDLESRDTLEDLALFARWYYSSWREGLWIPFLRADDIPYRKLFRSIGKLTKAEKSKVPITH